MVRDYVSFTGQILSSDQVKSPCLVLAPEANLDADKVDSFDIYDEYVYEGKKCIVPTVDFFEFFSRYRSQMDLPRFESAVMLRVFEHIPVRQIDYFLWQLSTVLVPGALVHIVVPDMWAVATALRSLTESWADNPRQDYFKFMRLNYELLSEGDHVYDRHATWTDKYSVPVLLEMENYFTVIQCEQVHVDTDIIPPELYFIAKRL